MPRDSVEVFVTDAGHLNYEKLAELMTTQSEPEANIVKGILEASGIECVLVTQVPHNLYPFTVDGLAAIRIKVLASQLAAAQELLRDYEGNPEAGTDDGPDDDGTPFL
jgi:hypothetical protein